MTARQEWNLGREVEYHELDVQFIIVDDAFARELAELAGVEVGSNILLNHSRHWFEDGRVIDSDILNFSYQTLSVSTWNDAFEMRNENVEIEIELHGQLTPEIMPSELAPNGPWGLSVIVPETNLLQISWFVQTDNSAGIVEAGEALLFEHFGEGVVSIRAIDLDAATAMTRNTFGLVMFFMFGFVGTLILIGLTNVISTISENVKTRSGEFAVLQSVGMTSGGIKRMLNLESVFSSLRALMIGIPLGILGTYGVYLAMRNMGVFNFSIPVLWIISTVLAIFLVTWLAMRYAANKLKSRNIIETIRSGSGM
jgi:putative ABC transport system permease protein